MLLLLGPNAIDQEVDESGHVSNVGVTVEVTVTCLGNALTIQQVVDQCRHVLDVDLAVIVHVAAENGGLIIFAKFASSARVTSKAKVFPSALYPKYSTRLSNVAAILPLTCF